MPEGRDGRAGRAGALPVAAPLPSVAKVAALPPPGSIVNDVLIGHGGELFLARGAHAVLDYTSGRRQLPQRAFSRFAALIGQRAAVCERAGIGYRHLIFPDKQTVLREAYPMENAVSLGALHMEHCAEVAAQLLFPRDLLASAAERTYQRTDTHATHFGTMLVCAQVVAAFTGEDQAHRTREMRRRLTQRRMVTGDLGSKLAPPVSAEETGFEWSWPMHGFSNDFAGGNNGIVDLFVAPAAPYEKRLLLFGDSFGRSMAKVLTYFFREVAFLRTPFLHREILQQMKPDLVLTQGVERYLGSVKGDDAAPSFCMYPYMARTQLPYTPSREFADAYSAFLSYPRRPYRDFMQRIGLEHRLG